MGKLEQNNLPPGQSFEQKFPLPSRERVRGPAPDSIRG